MDRTIDVTIRIYQGEIETGKDYDRQHMHIEDVVRYRRSKFLREETLSFKRGTTKKEIYVALLEELITDSRRDPLPVCVEVAGVEIEEVEETDEKGKVKKTKRIKPTAEKDDE